MDYARTSRWGAVLPPNCTAAELASSLDPSTAQVEKIFMDSDDWKTAGVRIDMLKALARKCVAIIRRRVQRLCPHPRLYPLPQMEAERIK